MAAFSRALLVPGTTCASAVAMQDLHLRAPHGALPPSYLKAQVRSCREALIPFGGHPRSRSCARWAGEPALDQAHCPGPDGAVITAVHVAMLVFIIVAGLTRAKPANLRPFAPHGARGVFSGAAYVYFTFTGFDAVATSAEEVGPMPEAQPRLPPGPAYAALASLLAGRHVHRSARKHTYMVTECMWAAGGGGGGGGEGGRVGGHSHGNH